MIHGLAAGANGVIVVCIYGEDPKRLNPRTGEAGCKIHEQVMRFAIGDVDETVRAILPYEGVEHANVYMPLHIVRRDLKGNQRGKLKDIVAVLGLVADADSDTGKAGTACPVKPSLVLETSPGNSQQFILFDRHVLAADAAPVAKALCAAMKTDSGTGDVAHVWRVPGTLNWPNAKKLERGRDPAPVPVKVLTPWDGSRHSFDDVKEAVSRWEAKPEDAHANNNRSSSTDPQEILARLPLALQLALQAAPPAGIDRSRYAFGVLCSLLRHGLTDTEIHAVTAAFPGNIFARYHDEFPGRRRITYRLKERYAAIQHGLRSIEFTGQKALKSSYAMADADRHRIATSLRSVHKIAGNGHGATVICTCERDNPATIEDGDELRGVADTNRQLRRTVKGSSGFLG
jgi:hypothetical protein